ncbi:P-selectin-like isoform X2 [Poeciliopsis prolifica]|uniref:P-selectin-like isoform X2 n=1 Tax=Poeciliopsis prolifica TaxID=188132 RepID=UPI002412F12C|nr:P-selectin-like isoform X2 [Poeciliopsis prolifica]
MRTMVVVPLMSVLYFASGQHLGLREGSFTFYEIQKPWSEAQASCREHHTDLITIRSETDIQVLDGTRGWIGLHRDNNTSDWKWSRRDEAATFLNWEENEPLGNEHCVYQRPFTKKRIRRGRRRWSTAGLWTKSTATTWRPSSPPTTTTLPERQANWQPLRRWADRCLLCGAFVHQLTLCFLR